MVRWLGRRPAMTDSKTAALGRWRDILAALGIPRDFLNGKHQACPMCGGKDRARWDNKGGHGSYFCNQCGAGDGFRLLQQFHGWDFPHAAREVDRVLASGLPKTVFIKRGLIKRQDVAQLWTEARQIKRGDPVDQYLRSRDISPDDLQVVVPYWAKGLRFSARMWHAPSRKFITCMLGMFRDADGEIGTLHRTYLADVEPRRMFLPCAIPRGGAIRLGEARETMGVAEGIETALSAGLLFKMSVWATTSERLLREWSPPPDVKHVVVFGDNDKNYVGHYAAYHLACRLAMRGYRVDVQIPDVKGWDWNDVLKNEITTERYQLALPELWTPGRATRSTG
jgi:putative DNA primase/helicase